MAYAPANPDTSTDASITVGNEAGAELPSTGGPGTAGFVTFGAALLTASLALARRRIS